MLIFPINLIILIYQPVLSIKCPFCANFKSKCSKKENIYSMDCENFKIEGKSSASYWKEPPKNEQENIFQEMNKHKDDEGNTMTCIVVDYHLIKNNVSNDKPQKDPNATMPEPFNYTVYNFDRQYTIKTCLVDSKKNPACKEWLAATEEMEEQMKKLMIHQPILIKIDHCESTNSAGFSAMSGRLIVFIMSIVLLQMFVSLCQ